MTIARSSQFIRPSDEDIAIGSVELTLTMSNTEGDVVTDEMVLSFKTGPEAPQTAEGPDYVDVYLTTTSDYMTAGLPEITEYNWYLEPAEAGSVEGKGLTSTVTWNPEYLGTAYISVAAIGECGEGEVSVPFEVTVDNTVGTGDPEGNGLGLSIYPNPGHGIFNILISSDQMGYQEIKLTNILGETILKESVKLNNTINYQLNLEDLPDGIYFLVVGSNDQMVTRKLVKR